MFDLFQLDGPAKARRIVVAMSGGVDSSLIVAMMQKQSARPVRTFTIGFDVAEYNEAKFQPKRVSCDSFRGNEDKDIII